MDQPTRKLLIKSVLTIQSGAYSTVIMNIAQRIDYKTSPNLRAALESICEAIASIYNPSSFCNAIQPALDLLSVQEGQGQLNLGFKEYLDLEDSEKVKLLDILDECVRILDQLKQDSPDDMLAWVKLKALRNYLDPTSLNFATYAKREM